MHPVDIAALLLRATLGTTMLAHGWNHAFGGGRIAGTTRWFASIGMRPAWVHAWVATITEAGCGLLLIAGLLTPLTLITSWRPPRPAAQQAAETDTAATPT